MRAPEQPTVTEGMADMQRLNVTENEKNEERETWFIYRRIPNLRWRQVIKHTKATGFTTDLKKQAIPDSPAKMVTATALVRGRGVC